MNIQFNINSVRNNQSSLYTGFVIYGIRYTEGICTGFGRIQGARYIFVIPLN